MSQLIALIIAIALGAIVTAIGFVFLGDAFTKNSERGVALQFISQASQVEMAMTAHRAEKAKSAGESATSAATLFSALTTDGYLKDVITPPKGTYDFLKSGTKSYLTVTSDQISPDVCLEVNKLKNKSLTASPQLKVAGTPSAGADITQLSDVTGANVGGNGGLNGDVYGCFTGFGTTNVFAYRVE